MLKISVKDEERDQQLLLELEGRLAGPWVEELERSWEAERRRAPSEHIIVRLSNVSFIDEAGKELLNKIFHAGGKIEGTGCMVRAIIARITGALFSAHDCEGESRRSLQRNQGEVRGDRE
jgi:anti-anti-sigma regulatory factor